MGERYECRLGNDLLKTAEKELNEPPTNELRLAAIDQLKKRFQNEQDEFHLLRSDDSFLLRFLRVKKFDQNKAYAALLNYHRQRKEFPEIFAKTDNTVQIARIFGSGALAAIRHKAKDGSTVTIYRPGLVPVDILFVEQIAAFLLFVERLLEEEDVQDSLPVRIKSLQLVNEFAIFSVAYAIAKPFMKKKLQDRLRLHGDNFTKLHDTVDAKGLPSFLAGVGPDIDSNFWKTEVLSTVGRGELTGL